MHRLPLFPLNVVLFPGAQLPLHIFEPRYRTMINRCIEEQKPFGIVLIREGVEVGGMSIPHLIGTMAEIQDAYRLADGRMYIVVEGTKRFRVNYPITLEPYIVAMVTELDDEQVMQDQADELIAIYKQYHRTVAAATGMKTTQSELPTEPVALSYYLADAIQLPLKTKQGWLEASTSERIAEIAHSLRFELSLLPPIAPDQLDREPPFEYTSWN